MQITDPVIAISAVWFGAVAAAVAWGDLRHRLIANRLVAACALGSLVLLADGRMPVPAYGVAVLLAVASLLAGSVLFSRGWVGGGDVKLLAAMLLWFPPWAALYLFEVMLILGGLLSLAMLAARGLARRGLVPGGPVRASLLDEELSVPYGVAIAGAGLATFQFVWL